MTRIIAGVAGGRSIRTPKGRDTRPTTDRVREALFSRVEALLDLDGARVLDLYSGSGALGLEALSRGASHLLAVEKHRATAALIGANARELGLADRVQVRSAPVEVVLAGGRDGGDGDGGGSDGRDGVGDDRGVGDGRVGGYHLVLADPPYPLAEEALTEMLTVLVHGRWLDPDALLIVERSSRSPRPTWPEGLAHLDSRTYGETALHLAEPGLT